MVQTRDFLPSALLKSLYKDLKIQRDAMVKRDDENERDEISGEKTDTIVKIQNTQVKYKNIPLMRITLWCKICKPARSMITGNRNCHIDM